MRAAVPDGFTIDDFPLDEPARTLTCPADPTRPISSNRTVKFGSLCSGCPLRDRCTRSATGRDVLLHEHELLLRAARRQAHPRVQAGLPPAPADGRTHCRVAGPRRARKARYRAVARKDQWLHHRTAALNLRRCSLSA